MCHFFSGGSLHFEELDMLNSERGSAAAAMNSVHCSYTNRFPFGLSRSGLDGPSTTHNPRTKRGHGGQARLGAEGWSSLGGGVK